MTKIASLTAVKEPPLVLPNIIYSNQMKLLFKYY